MEPLLGQSLGRYKIVELLGEGGMGAVYRARDVTLQRDVAIKVLQPQSARLAGFQERFLQEARTAARLDHPGIVKVHDFGQARDLLYIVMEFVGGPDLQQAVESARAAGRSVPLAEACGLVRQVCLALDYAHHRGILHRDVKPGNIMLKPEHSDGLPYRPVLTDLGLAKLLQGGDMTQAGASLGTPSYMSPEQAMGEPVGPPSDVYSLGILLYELAVGRLPFQVTTLTEAIRCHTKEPPPPPRSLRPDLPESLARVILRALEKQPAARFPTAAAMAEALAQATPAGSNETSALMAPAPKPAVAEPPPDLPSASALDRLPLAPVDPARDHISILAPDGNLRWLLLAKDETAIGSAAGNDLVLSRGGVAPEHARVRRDAAAYRITDLGSESGTYLANVRLLPGVPEAWPPDKALRIGDYWLRLERAQQAAMGSMVGPSQSADGQAATGPQATARIAAFLDSANLTVAPGGSVTASLTIMNQGSVVDHFRVSATNLPPAWVPAPPPLIRLLPGSQQQIALLIQPPRTPESRAGTYPLTVRVASQDAPDQFAEVSAALTVTAYQQFRIELRPQRRSGPGPAGYRLQVSNQGNGDLSLQLDAADPEEACEYRFDPAQPVIAAGRQAQVALAVRAGEPLVEGVTKCHRFTVTAHPIDAPWLAQQAQGEWEQTARPVIARPQIGCSFWLLWALATTVGGLPAALSLLVFDWWQAKGMLGPLVVNVLFYGLLGLGVVLLQWLLLRRYLRASGWWIPAGLAGFALYGAAVGLLRLPEPPEQSVVALIVGPVLLAAAQWLALYGKVRWSGLWLVAGTAGWLGDLSSIALFQGVDLGGLGWKLCDATGGRLYDTLAGMALPADLILDRLGGALVWATIPAVAGVITGAAMLWLLSHPAEGRSDASTA